MRGALLLATALSAVISTQAFLQRRHPHRQSAVLLGAQAALWNAITPGSRFVLRFWRDTFCDQSGRREYRHDRWRRRLRPNGESSQTSQMVVVNDQVYGQDRKHAAMVPTGARTGW